MLSFFVVIMIASVFYINKLNKTSKNNTVEATSSSKIITTQSEWEAGTLVNIDSSIVPGDIKIVAESKIDTSGKTLSASIDEGNKQNVVDGNTDSSWGAVILESTWWKIDLGSNYSVSKFRVMVNTVAVSSIQVSLNDVDYTSVASPTGGDLGWQEFIFSPMVDARYVKLVFNATGIPALKNANELEIYTASSIATHTSAATQITNADLYEWQTFTPAYTEPANTDITFKFRTSTNSTDWSAWTATPQTVPSGTSLDLTTPSLGIVSKTGDPGLETFYKYIQVESTLTSTDGVSTPTLSDYTIGYHTNVKPTAPTAASVTIGS